MPFILIIVGIIAALGFGGFLFMQKPEDSTIDTPVARIEEPAPVVATATPSTTITPDTTPEATQTEKTPTTPAVTPTSTPTTPAPVAPKTVYKNGTYTVSTSYNAPGRSTHSVDATITIKDDVITASNVSYGGDNVNTSTEYQNKFSKGYQTQVIGKNLGTVSLSRVGGASLTTNAFNKALAEVKVSAQS
jgi:hypothetical protein